MKKLSLILILFTSVILPQNLKMPQSSPFAQIEQETGVSKIKITYHRPGVRGRVIWGNVVPTQGQIWRAGANENTVFSFSDDCYINGNKLPAGDYGFHIAVGESEWELIFSKNSTAWGSFFYNPADDALRIKVKPQQTGFKEWLEYGFEDLTDSTAAVFLHWEKLKVSFTVKFDVKVLTVKYLARQLEALAGFSWQGYYEAANYCYENECYPALAESWISKSVDLDRNLVNLDLKYRILLRSGNKSAGENVYNEIRELLSQMPETAVNRYGYQLLSRGLIDEAVMVFEINVKRFPDSWNVYDSLGEAYSRKGEKDKSKEMYLTALKLAPESQKNRIKTIVDSLR